MQPIIMHLDMNSYFASVEQQDHPEYRDKPLGVCEHLGGILIAASVQAKRWGIKTGTPVWEAKKIYPKIIVTQTHPDRYRFYNQSMVKVVSDYTDKVERYSIDEVFLDVTKVCNIKIPFASWRTNFQTSKPPAGGQISNNKFLKDGRLKYYIKKLKQELSEADPWQEAVKIAQEIKERMKTEVGDYLTCSIGIAENKLQAKIASDLKKPDGIVVISDKRLEKRDKEKTVLQLTKEDLYNRLKLTDIPGIGNRQEKNLNELGIKTLIDLKNYPKSKLIARFGVVFGHHIYNMGQLQGSFKPKVVDDKNIKSIGHMYTLPLEYRKVDFFSPVLYKLCEMVARRLRKQNLMGNVIHFFVAGDFHKGCGKSKKLKYFVNDGREIYFEAIKIYSDLMREAENKIKFEQIKLIGITVAGLTNYINQLSLFTDEKKQRSVIQSLDKINKKYGDFTICRTPLLQAKKVFQDSIGFGRLKEMPAMYGRGG